MLAIRKVLLLSLVVSMGLFLYMSWPLPRYATTAIPAAGDNIEGLEARTMIRGDHLQLMYRLWLCADYFTGQTPWFYNLYEFNTGDDEARYVPRAHHFPFPLTFKLGEVLVNRAVGWNGTVFFTFWMTLFLTWLTLRRYCKSDGIAFFSSLFSIIFPYKWLTICAGSPTGFAMMWVPAIWLGLDVAFCESTARRRLGGGLLAGAALLFAAFCDSHVFYFSLLMSPPLAILCLLRAPAGRFRGWKNFLGQGLLSGGVYGLFGLLSIGYGQFKKSYIATSAGGGVRSLKEVQLYSPNWREYFIFEGEHVYLGTLLLTVLALGGLFVVYRILRGQSTLNFSAGFLVLSLGIAACLMLGYGTEGPFGFAPIRGFRKFVPMFEMIRQPAKVFCLLPMLISTWMALLLYEGFRSGHLPRLWKIAPVFVIGWCTIEYAGILNPVLCVLDEEQPAYEAVHEDATARGKEARALILPLWPGDSAWSSLYEHYSSLYRIRMANGYSPVTPSWYSKDFFGTFSSMNQGHIRDVQLDDLLARGIDHLMLHENAFPQKVSAFPTGFTLNRLQAHPRLTPLKYHDGVWAFRIEPGPVAGIKRPPSWDWAFPSRRYEMEAYRLFDCKAVDDPGASRQKYVRFDQPGQRMAPLKSYSVQPMTNQVFSVRVRGKGSCYIKAVQGQQILGMRLFRVDSKEWSWMDVPLHWVRTFGRTGFIFIHEEGQVDIDAGLLLYGPSPLPEPGASVTISADRFFHEGISHDKGLLLRPMYNRPISVINGLNLPMEPGTYRFALAAESQAAKGAHLVNFYLSQDGHILAHLEVMQGGEAAFTVEVPDNRPVRLSMHYPRQEEVLIKAVTISRPPAAP